MLPYGRRAIFVVFYVHVLFPPPPTQIVSQFYTIVLDCHSSVFLNTCFNTCYNYFPLTAEPKTLSLANKSRPLSVAGRNLSVTYCSDKRIMGNAFGYVYTRTVTKSSFPVLRRVQKKTNRLRSRNNQRSRFFEKAVNAQQRCSQQTRLRPRARDRFRRSSECAAQGDPRSKHL